MLPFCFAGIFDTKLLAAVPKPNSVLSICWQQWLLRTPTKQEISSAMLIEKKGTVSYFSSERFLSLFVLWFLHTKMVSSSCGIHKSFIGRRIVSEVFCVRLYGTLEFKTNKVTKSRYLWHINESHAFGFRRPVAKFHRLPLEKKVPWEQGVNRVVNAA